MVTFDLSKERVPAHVNPVLQHSSEHLSSDVSPLPVNRQTLLRKAEQAKASGSRIPVRSKHGTASNPDQHQPRVHESSHPVSRRPAISPPRVASRMPIHEDITLEHQDFSRRAPSPPVPALAKALRKQGVLHTEETAPSPQVARPVERHHTPPTKYGATRGEATLPPIAISPPVYRQGSPPVHRQRGAQSPPVPVLRKKGPTHSNGVKTDSSSVHLPPLVAAEAGVILQQLSNLRKVILDT